MTHLIKYTVKTICWTFIFFTSAVIACGPYYQPRYSGVLYMDPELAGKHNFDILMQDFWVTPDSSEHVSDPSYRERQDNYFAAVQSLIDTSQRPIFVNLSAQDLSDGLCKGNDRQSNEAIYKEFLGLGKLPADSSQSQFKNAFSYLNGEIMNRCGRYTAFANQPEQIKTWVDVIKNFDGPSPWLDYSWLLMARYHVYGLEHELAEPYLRQMTSSGVEVVKLHARELKTLVEVQKSTPEPLNLKLGIQNRYTFSGNFYAACVSNSIDNVLLYDKKLLLTSVNDQRVVELMQARDMLAGINCNAMSEEAQKVFDALTLNPQDNQVAADYASYLRAAQALYQTEYDRALEVFKRLQTSTDAWIAETSGYMLGRLHLIRAQKNWDGYSNPVGNINLDEIALAKAAFDSYTAQYPNGSYTDSVRGLERRLAYFAGDGDAYKGMLDSRLFAVADDLLTVKDSASSTQFSTLLQEWRKYTDQHADISQAPALMVAYEWLHHAKSYTLDDLMQQVGKFDDRGDLLKLLQNWYLFQSGQFQQVDTPDEDLELVTQADIGLAVVMAKSAEAQQNYQLARKIWVAIHESTEQRKSWDALRAEIAATYLATGDYRGLTGKDSHVDHLKIFQDAFLNICDVSDLVAIANDEMAHDNARNAARYEAFVRRIHSNDFDGLYDLFEQINDVGQFVDIQKAAAMLIQDKNNPQGLMDLARFMFKFTYEPVPEFEINNKLKPDVASLKSCPSSYYGKEFYGIRDYFARVVEQHNNGDQSEAEAEALHYLVQCEKQSNHYAPCYWGKVETPILTGKQAFKRLYKKYPNSKWTDKTPYYYKD